MMMMKKVKMRKEGYDCQDLVFTFLSAGTVVVVFNIQMLFYS